MKKMNLLFVATALVLCFGCADDEIAVYPQPQIQPLPPVAPAPIREKTQADPDFTVASEANTKLRVIFRRGNSEHVFCNKLAERLAGQVVLEKADLLLTPGGDAQIMIQPEFELKDRSGGYYRIICNQITVTIYFNQKVYAVKTLEPAALPRKLGLQNAKDQYLKAAVKGFIPFLRKELQRLSNEEVAVSVIDFKLKNMQQKPSAECIAQQAIEITRIMKSTPGIINFANISQDASKATCSYRVVYSRERFPEGIVNVINSKLAQK